MSLHFWSVEYTFIAITPRSTEAQIGNTYYK